jgi:hypothetical protein
MFIIMRKIFGQMSEAVVKDVWIRGWFLVWVNLFGRLQDDLSFYNGNKKDYYNTSRIKGSIKCLENHGGVLIVTPV